MARLAADLTYFGRRVDVRKLKDSKTTSDADASALERIQTSIVRLLGNLDAELCQSVATVTPETFSEAALCWDKHNHVPFKVRTCNKKLS